MTITTLAWASLVLAAIPAVLFVLNLFWYRRVQPRDGAGAASEAVSVLIPARNEGRNLPATLESVLANRDAEFEVVVLDDHSTDDTAEIVKEFARRDSRVRLERAPELPPGWCGKQHACHVLAQRARHPILMFMDADVRLAPTALARLSVLMLNQRAALVSGVPRQELGTFSERLLLPLIHFVLLGYLPMMFMRWTRLAGFSAGCGQLFIARAEAYRATGGHAGIRASLHDGVKLPRLFRRAGFHTDLMDPTDLATCRMYQTNRETWLGLGKNATEGLAAPGAILPMTVLLLGGQVLPFFLLAGAQGSGNSVALPTAIAVALTYLPRLIGVLKFGQPIGSALLHPLGILSLMAIQWWALGRSWLGRPSQWKGRAYPASNPPGPARPAWRAGCIVAAGWIATLAAAAQVTTNPICPPFALRDQFETLHQVTFPRTNVMVLTIADKQGSEQLSPWIVALKEKRPARIEITGVAAVAGVPAFLRAGIRRDFVKRLSHPVLLDWKGEITPRFQPVKNQANLYVIDGRGQIRAHFSGGAKSEMLSKLFAAIETVVQELP